MSVSLREYEAVLIADPALNEEALTQLKTQFGEIVSRNGGRVQEISVLGRRKLGFRIGRHREGNYLQVKVQLPPSAVDAVRRTIHLIEPVIRLMVVAAVAVVAENGPVKAATSEGGV